MVPTISGLRRRGVTPEGLRDFVETAGVSRKPQQTELATLEHAIEDLEYFRTVRHISKEKITLGVPFYGYGFDLALTSPAISMNFAKIVSSFKGAERRDEWTMPDGKVLYYNGIPTMEKKALLAKEKASGIMIWQVLGDAKGSKSLLKTIRKTIQ